jgi:membrane protein
LFRIIRDGVGLWIEHNAFLHAGALAFFTLFSLAPTLIIAVSVTGVVLGEGAAQGEIVAQLADAMGAEAAGMVEQAVLASRPEEAGLLPTLVGVIAIAIGATTVFGQLRYSMNVFWGVRPIPGRGRIALFRELAKTRLLAFAVVLLIGLGLLLYFLAVIAIQILVASLDLHGPLEVLESQWLSGATQGMVAVLITALFIAALFKFLPEVLLSWRDVLPVALVTALMLTAGRQGIAVYLSKTAIASVYGAAASLLVVLMWVYFSALILLLGVALTRASLDVRGRPAPPSPLAVRVAEQRVT